MTRFEDLPIELRSRILAEARALNEDQARQTVEDLWAIHVRKQKWLDQARKHMPVQQMPVQQMPDWVWRRFVERATARARSSGTRMVLDESVDAVTEHMDFDEWREISMKCA